MQDDRRIAFEIFYAEHSAPVYRFALRLCGDPDDAEDLAAEALGKAFRKWSSFRRESSPRTWLCAIVLNEWRMMKRKHSIEPSSFERLRHVAATFEHRDLDLAKAIDSLSDPLREAFLLVKGEGFTHAEAAKATRVTVGTMYFRVSTAMRHLRERLAPFQERAGEVMKREM